MASLPPQLLLEIVQNLDYSNSSKDRLAQLINARDEKVHQSLNTFVQQREAAGSDQQRHLAMVQLKRDLDIVLFGKSASEYSVTSTTQTTTYSAQVPASSINSYTSYVPQLQTQQIYANTSYTSQQAPLNSPPSFASTTYQPATTYTQSTNVYAPQPVQQTYSFNSGSNVNSTQNLANPLQQQQYQQVNEILNYQPPQFQQAPAPAPQQQQQIKSQSRPVSTYSGEEETVKRSRKGEATEFDLDQRIQNIRSQKKAKQNQVLSADTNKIKKEQMRLQKFKELWVRGQPLVPELYKLFYDAADDLDYAYFLSLRHDLHLDDVPVKDLILRQQALLKQDGNSSNGINPDQFLTLMDQGLADDDIYSLLQIFFYLDFNNNGLLDTDEILLGFVMLANASEKDKIEAAFLIVDDDGSGTLDLSEMTKYMRSVIRMGDGRKFKSDDAFEHEFLVEKMAASTALVIFKEMDLDNSGRISHEEFVLWHNLHGMDTQGFQEEKNKVSDVLKAASKERSEKLMKYNAFTLQNDDYRELTNKRLNSVLDSNISHSSVNQFRESLHLGEVRFLDAVRFLKEHKVSERLGFTAFYNFMKELYERCNIKIDLNPIKEILNEFYTSIDLDSNGFIDWNEILGAFSLLCMGTENEKIRGVFEVFDMNNDQVLQFNEIYTLFLSSFNLIFMRNPDSEIARSDPKKLAFSMAISAFADNQLDPYTNGLDFETFVKWYRNFDMI